MEEPKAVGRRDALVGISASAVSAAVASVAGARSPDSEAVVDPAISERPRSHHDATAVDMSEGCDAFPPGYRLNAPGPEVRALFGHLADGGELGAHWRVDSVHAVREGAIPVLLSTASGARFGVEIFRDAPDGCEPIARAAGLALSLVNGGNGSRSTGELAGLGIQALGRELEARRREGVPIPSELRSFVRRTQDRFGHFDLPV